jgi:hypothetical protein
VLVIPAGLQGEHAAHPGAFGLLFRLMVPPSTTKRVTPPQAPSSPSRTT